MIPVGIEDITADHIDSLVANGVREGRAIEYKQILPGMLDKDKKEFLADVSSFANAGGGDLIYGVTAEDGVPTKVIGLTAFDPDKDVLRLESTIRDGIKPRILGLRTHVIEDTDKGPVLIVRIPKSWSGPHMVTYKGTSRFFARSSAGKFQMDVDELRSAFALAGDLPERIRGWRDERVGRIIAGEPPVPLIDAARMVLHLVPLDSFDDSYRISGSRFGDSGCRTGFVPMGLNGWDHRLNLDGFVTFGGSASDGNENAVSSYCQVFRSGRIESVCSRLGRDKNDTPVIASISYEKMIMEATAEYLRTLDALDVHPPIVLMLTFTGVKGIRFGVDLWEFGDVHPIDRDVLLLPDVLIEEMPRDLPRLMRATFDAVWNACGLLRSSNYDEKGNWTAGPLSDVPRETVP